MSAATQGLVRLPVWRARFVLGLLLLAFGVLVARSIHLQALKTEFLQEKGDARYSRVIEVPATRGRIVDRHGDALAVSTPVKSIWAIPSDARLSRSSGPQCVCEALSNSASGGRWNSRFTCSSSDSRSARGMPIRSVVTIPSRAPFASSMASALANRSCTLPSEGLSRAA